MGLLIQIGEMQVLCHYCLHEAGPHQIDQPCEGCGEDTYQPFVDSVDDSSLPPDAPDGGWGVSDSLSFPSASWFPFLRRVGLPVEWQMRSVMPVTHTMVETFRTCYETMGISREEIEGRLSAYHTLRKEGRSHESPDYADLSKGGNFELWDAMSLYWLWWWSNWAYTNCKRPLYCIG